jgi:hypothetical protein
MTQVGNEQSYEYKYTVPIEKSLRGDRWIIRGVAAGPEVDKQGDVITPEAINSLATQINEAPVPFRNQHKVDDIMEDMGEVIKAFVTPDYQLEVEVELDRDNPSAQYLWKKLEQGKQYGMSIRGNSISPYTELSKAYGRPVRKHGRVTISEVSVTTRPVYSHSLGTVLKKAIDLAEAENAAGDNVMDTPVTGEAQAASETSAPENVSATEPAPSEVLVKSLMDNDDFKNLITTAVTEAVQAQAPATEEVEKSEEAEESTETQSDNLDVETLVKSIVAEVSSQTDTKIEELANRITERGPAVLVKSEQETADEVIKSLREDPRQALRVGLAAKHGELDRL